MRKKWENGDYKNRIKKGYKLRLLTDVLNIDDDTKIVSTQEEAEKAIVAAEPDRDEIQIESDFDRARHNILDALTTAKEAVEHMFVIAKDKEDAKSFDSLNGLLKNIADSSKQLVDLYNTKQQFKERKAKSHPRAIADEKRGDVNINNAIFTGTPAELKTFIENLKKSS